MNVQNERNSPTKALRTQPLWIKPLRIKMLGLALCATSLALPVGASAQTQYQHDRAVAAQNAHDRRHHTTAKVVGGSAVGGAVVGGLLGGPKGAVIGAGVGAGGGLIANKVRKDNGVKKREERRDYPHSN